MFQLCPVKFAIQGVTVTGSISAHCSCRSTLEAGKCRLTKGDDHKHNKNRRTLAASNSNCSSSC